MVVDLLALSASNPVVISTAFAVGRNLIGWVSNSLADGQIQGYEWSQLGKTVLKFAIATVSLAFGLEAFVPGITAEHTAGITTAIDWLRSEFKRK